MAITLTQTSAGVMSLDGTLVTTPGFVSEVLAADRTITQADHGKIFLVDAVDLTATLPAAPTEGTRVVFRIKTPSTVTGFTIAGAINGGSTSAVNTAATDAIGNQADLLYADASWIATFSGTWAVT